LPQTIRYASVLAKIGAQRSNLLSDTKLKTLADSKTLPDFAGQLRDTPYQEQIAKIPPPFTGHKLERAFNENLIETCQKIIKYSPKVAKEYLSLYLLRFEVENIKMLIKLTSTNASPEQKLARLYPFVGRYIEKPALLEDAAKSVDLTHLVEVFKKTVYWQPLNMGLASYNESGSTKGLDVFVDVFFYEHLYEAFERLPKKEKSSALFYAGPENDGFVLLTLLRGKNFNYDPNWLRIAVPNNYLRLTKQQVDAILSAIDFDAAYKIVQETEYAKYFVKEDTIEDTLTKAEKALRKTTIDHAYANKISIAFNIGMPLAYLTRKETEVYNLRALALGIDGGMVPDVIRAQLFG